MSNARVVDAAGFGSSGPTNVNANLLSPFRPMVGRWSGLFCARNGQILAAEHFEQTAETALQMTNKDSVSFLVSLLPGRAFEDSHCMGVSIELLQSQLPTVQRNILRSHLLRHFQAGLMRPAQLVNWVRAALRMPHLLSSVIVFADAAIAYAEAQPAGGHDSFLRWTRLVKALAMLRTTDHEQTVEE